MSARALILVTYIALVAFFSSLALYAFSQISYMQHHGVSTSARLLGYYQTGAGRAASMRVYGRVEFPVNGKAVDTNVIIGQSASPSDADFNHAVTSGNVKIVYDPQQPQSVVYNENNELAGRKPGQLGLMIALGGLFISSIIFLPAAFALWNDSAAK